MIEQCPHCRERVFFSSSICPSCGADKNLPPAATGRRRPPATGAEPTITSAVAFWCALALICTTIFSFLADWALVSNSGSIDYRNRVTGARLLVSGTDPYHYKWQPGAPDRWCDVYDNPSLPVTKTTVTPTLLVLLAPLANLPYPLSQRLWFAAQWAMLAGLWFTWLRRPGTGNQWRWWWTALVVAFSFTLAWRHHLDRGQIYVALAFLSGVWMRLTMGGGARAGWLPGLAAGLLVALRPPLVLVVGPFIGLRRRNQWPGAVAGLVLGIALPLLWKPAVWQDYGRAMEAWSAIYRNQSEPRPGPRAFPAEIEGVPTDLLATYQVRQYVDSSGFRLLRTLGWPAVSDQAVLGLLVLLVGLWFWRSRPASDGALMLGLAGWTFLSDAFLPAYRNPYNDVMILNAFALLPLLGRLEKPALLLALLSLALGIWIANIQPPDRWWIYLPTLAAALVALPAILRPAINPLERRERRNE